MNNNQPEESGRKRSGWLNRWTPMLRPDWISWVVPMTIVLLACLLLVIWRVLPTPTNMAAPAIDVFESALDEALVRNAGNFDLWYKSNMVIQFTLIFTALLATVFASITTKDNAEHIKKWSVLLTAITATFASVQSTFHIRENIETFIRSTGDLVLLETDYLAERAPLDKDIKKSAGKDLDPETEKKLIEIRQKYMARFMTIETARMRAWANAGQQSPVTPDNNAAGKK